jgi:hypothetical protein
MIGPPTQLVTGEPTVLAAQCNLRNSVDATGKPVPAIYNANDIITAEVIPSRSTIPTFAPAAGFFTAQSTQGGYAQGQVQATPTQAQMALLMPGIRYTILWFRQLADQVDPPELIARMPLDIEPLAIN